MHPLLDEENISKDLVPEDENAELTDEELEAFSGLLVEALTLG